VAAKADAAHPAIAAMNKLKATLFIINPVFCLQQQSGVYLIRMSPDKNLLPDSQICSINLA